MSDHHARADKGLSPAVIDNIEKSYAKQSIQERLHDNRGSWSGPFFGALIFFFLVTAAIYFWPQNTNTTVSENSPPIQRFDAPTDPPANTPNPEPDLPK